MLTHCIDIPAKCHASEWYLFRQRHHYQLSDVFHQPAFALVKRTEIRLRPHFHGRCYGRDPPVYREPIGLGLGIRTISAFLAIWAPPLPIRVLDVNAFAFVHRSGCHSFCIANIFLYVPRTFLEVYMSFFFTAAVVKRALMGRDGGMTCLAYARAFVRYLKSGLAHLRKTSSALVISWYLGPT